MDQEQRDRIIERLIDNDIAVNSGEWYLRDILRSGFTGYQSMTDEELLQSAEESGIDTE